MQQRPFDGIEATSVHPAMPRFYRIPQPPHYDPGWSDGPTPKKRRKLLMNPWFWVALVEIMVIGSLIFLLILG